MTQTTPHAPPATPHAPAVQCHILDTGYCLASEHMVLQGGRRRQIACHVPVPAQGEQTIYMAFIFGNSRQELIEMHRWLAKMTPQGVIDRTSAYWRLWVGGTNINFGDLPPKVVESFKRSLLVLRTQIDNGGAIIAANDSDIMQFARDTYSYMWPRDGALVANALDSVAQGFITMIQVQTLTGVLIWAGVLWRRANTPGAWAAFLVMLVIYGSLGPLLYGPVVRRGDSAG